MRKTIAMEGYTARQKAVSLCSRDIGAPTLVSDDLFQERDNDNRLVSILNGVDMPVMGSKELFV